MAISSELIEGEMARQGMDRAGLARAAGISEADVTGVLKEHGYPITWSPTTSWTPGSTSMGSRRERGDREPRASAWTQS